MNLKQARRSGKLAQFIQEHKRTQPHTRKYRFRAVVKLMALNQPKAKRGRPQAK
jgi:hypothetical protein